MTDDVALLLRRAAFGPTAAELGQARAAGYTATLSALLTPSGADSGAARAPMPELGPDPYAGKTGVTLEQSRDFDGIRERQIAVINRWWLDRMTVANHQGVEKLVFFWHGHWATSVKKVRSPQLMLAQQRTLRSSRDYADMTRKMVVDPALVAYLDGHLNTRAAPNENLARELLELFTLGIGQYNEKDLKEAGRALTGWRFSLTEERSVFEQAKHDPGIKTILGVTASHDAASLVELLLRQPACAEHVAARLWLRYASSTTPIPEATRDAMTAEFPRTRAMLRALFQNDSFQATAGTLVKQPIEWFVGAMRQLGIRPATLPEKSFIDIVEDLTSLGQRPFAPPNVGGWPSGAAWLSSAAAQVRLRLAGRLAKMLVADRLTPEGMAYVLGVDGWTNRTYAVLREASDPQRLLTIGLVSPEYLVT
ncbi:DUF1800 domain-containing protein [Micromonospora sp. CPCC 205371]|nr:DUF1800 domain-containing protein [Micromonospora sp. CPCC 205371]